MIKTNEVEIVDVVHNHGRDIPRKGTVERRARLKAERRENK